MATKKYVSLAKLSAFLAKLKTTFAPISHSHTIADISNYAVDAALSDTSTNPVQNKVINEEFDSVVTAMNALESVVDSKADNDHNHDSAYDTIGSANTALTSAKTYTDSRLTPVTTSGDGAAYTATVEGISSLTIGASFIMLPNVVSTTTMPTLDVNGLGAKYIRRRLSTATGSTTVGNVAHWLTEGKPVRVIYDGTFWLIDTTRPSASDIYGAVPIANGGTGATSAEGVLTNLGITATADELNYVDGVTSSIQDQLDGKVNSDDHEWTMIYDSGVITEAVNAFANIDITGCKNLVVAVECVNDGTNTNSKNGSVTFVATNGTTYQFPVLTTMFSNGSYTSGCMARFEIMNGWIICPCAPRTLRASNFLNVDVEGGTADTLANTYGGLMKCTNALSTMMISALDQDTSYYLNAGSRAIVWGCKA